MELKQARAEIRGAEKALSRMKDAKTLEDLEDEWRHYLSAIEKIWIKTERSLVQNPKFQPWQGSYQRIRKKDSLLRYLKHARNSDQHTIETLVETKPGKQEIKIEGPVAISRLRIDKGQLLEYEGTKPLQITITPERTELVPVKDSSKRYNPPFEHQGKPITWPDPIMVAELGLAFYKAYVDEAEKKFLKQEN